MCEKAAVEGAIVRGRTHHACATAPRRSARQRWLGRTSPACLLLSLASGIFLDLGPAAAVETSGAIAPAAPAVDTELLAASDLFSAAPEEFRVEVEVRQGSDAHGMPLEIWRRGEGLAL